MSAPLMPGCPLTEALEGSAFRLLPSDNNPDSLNFRQLQAGLATAGLAAGAPPPQGMSGVFNACMAALPPRASAAAPAPQEPGLTPPPKMALSNG